MVDYEQPNMLGNVNQLLVKFYQQLGNYPKLYSKLRIIYPKIRVFLVAPTLGKWITYNSLNVAQLFVLQNRAA